MPLRAIKALRALYPWLRHRFVDGGYTGPKLKERLSKIGNWTIQIFKRSDKAEGFELTMRWVVERTFACLGHCRRLSKDLEAYLQSAAAWVLLAPIRLLTRKVARQ
jgi:putative transposase